MKAPITIVESRYGFDVFMGERYASSLSWDEMLGAVAQLTHPDLGTMRYAFEDADYWLAAQERHAAILASRRRIAIPADFGIDDSDDYTPIPF